MRKFLGAYRAFPGGLKHDLLVLCKGFEGDRLPSEYLEELAGIKYRTLILNDQGFDIMPYFTAAKVTNYATYCFLNSFSEPLDCDWLRKLSFCLQEPGVGVVGATGSWASIFSLRQLQSSRPSAYDGLFPPAISARSPPSGHHPLWRMLGVLRRQLGTTRYLAFLRRRHAPFPTCHVRSNAFMLLRETMLKLRCGHIRTKEDALAFESGRRSLTAQIVSAGLSARVVGRNGIGYKPESWPESETFWQAEQGNLLVADNRTKEYAEADPIQRRFLSHYAWGTKARGVGERTRIPPQP